MIKNKVNFCSNLYIYLKLKFLFNQKLRHKKKPVETQAFFL